jgi:hypothetical protein
MAEEYDDIDVEEEWDEDIDEGMYVTDDFSMVGPRILPGQEDRIHYQAETGYGLLSTTAEGAMGKKLRKSVLATRTDQERFRDNVARVARDVEGLRPAAESLTRLIPRIPDIRYKSPAGCIFGLMAVDLVGKNLDPEGRRQIKKIFEKVREVREKSQRINEIDVVRYAHLMKNILNSQS